MTLSRHFAWKDILPPISHRKHPPSQTFVPKWKNKKNVVLGYSIDEKVALTIKCIIQI